MPDSMETSYNQWVGRKETSLRRRTLDCGHPNLREVHYHYWCDRLSCSPACAEAEHDCGLFKGKSESGIEEEAVEPEAVVNWLHAVLPEQQLTAEELVVLENYYGSASSSTAPPAPRQPFTLDPASYRALYGPPEPTGAPILGVTTPGDPWSDIVDTYQRISDDQDTRRAFFMPIVEAEAERLEMEIRMRINGLTPLLRDLPAPWVAITDDGIGRFHDDPDALPVDAAPEPDPAATSSCPEGRPMREGPWLERGGRLPDGQEWATCGCGFVHYRRSPWPRPKPPSWWRRMFPGGTR